MPMDIQPSRGETFTVVQIPQKANSTAMETIRRLSLERLPSRSFRSRPNPQPSSSTPALAAMGSATVLKLTPLPSEASASEIAAL